MNKDVSAYAIQTPMIKELHAVLKQWILCDFSGGLISGYARIGKSWAVRQISDYILDHDGNHIPIYRVRYGLRDKKTIRGVYHRIAFSLGLALGKRPTADELLSQMLLFFADSSKSNRNRKVVLIVDEAQELNIDQLFVFVELCNELEELEVRMSVFFIANTDRFEPVAEELLQEVNRFIRERYFNYIHEFHGIRSVDDLRTCLTCYDESPMSPPEDERTWLQYYCPKAFAAGFRLDYMADELWSIWNSEYANRFGYESWGMTYFNRTLSIILRDYFPEYWSRNKKTLREIMIKSLKAAGNEPTLTTVFPK